MTSELQLFVLWDKSRHVEKRILESIGEHFRVVCSRELCIDLDPLQFYRSFYGPSLPDANRKMKLCGTGPFLLVVVKDEHPEYDMLNINGSIRSRNVKMVKLKDLYREWAGKGHRVHGTVESMEFERDISLLTGTSAEMWETREALSVTWRFVLPSAWAQHAENYNGAQPYWGRVVARTGNWRDFIVGIAPHLGIEDVGESKCSPGLFAEAVFDCRYQGKESTIVCVNASRYDLRHEFVMYLKAESSVKPFLGLYLNDGKTALLVATRITDGSAGCYERFAKKMRWYARLNLRLAKLLGLSGK